MQQHVLCTLVLLCDSSTRETGVRHQTTVGLTLLLSQEMKAELKLKDDAYSMLQRQQTSEIDALIDAMAR